MAMQSSGHGGRYDGPAEVDDEEVVDDAAAADADAAAR